MDKLLSDISEYIDRQRDNIVEDWVSLVRIPSVKTAPDGPLPFGKNVDICLSAVTKLFNKNGFDMKKKTESGYAILCNKGKKGGTVGVFAHSDVVPVNESEWTLTKPFEPIVKNGYVIGRGCRDNKNGIIATLYALKALKAVGRELDNSLLVFVGGNEEDGMKDIEAFVESEVVPDVSLVPDNCFPYSRGEWGIAKLMVKSKRRFADIVDFSGGEAYNVTLGLLNVVLKHGKALEEALRLSDTELEIKDGLIRFRQKGIAGHVSSPEGTLNAALVGAERLLSIPELCENDKKILESLLRFISSPYGENIGIEKQDEYGRLPLGNGIVRVEDGHLCFSLDIRFSPITDKDEIIKKVKEAAMSSELETELMGASNGFLLEENKKLTDAFLRSISAFGADADSAPYVEKGLTYARYLKSAYSFGASLNWEPEKIGIAPGSGKAHQPNEAASIDGLVQCVKILASMMLDADSYLSVSK